MTVYLQTCCLRSQEFYILICRQQKETVFHAGPSLSIWDHKACLHSDTPPKSATPCQPFKQMSLWGGHTYSNHHTYQSCALINDQSIHKLIITKIIAINYSLNVFVSPKTFILEQLLFILPPPDPQLYCLPLCCFRLVCLLCVESCGRSLVSTFGAWTVLWAAVDQILLLCVRLTFWCTGTHTLSTLSLGPGAVSPWMTLGSWVERVAGTLSCLFLCGLHVFSSPGCTAGSRV